MSSNHRPTPTRRHLCAAGITAVLAALAPALARAQSNQPSIVNPASPNAASLSSLFWIIFWMAVVVFLLVEGLIVYSALHFRRRDGDAMPPQFHDNRRAEVAWTVVPMVVVLSLAVVSQQKIMAAYNPPSNAMVINVTGKQWFWKYEYPSMPIKGGKSGQVVTTATELKVPVGEPVKLMMKSEDVIHSFWVPQLAGKQDALPGTRYAGNGQTFIWFVVDKPGVFEGQCAELCGTQHSGMRLRVEAVPRAEFDIWLAHQATLAAEPAPGSPEARGKALVTNPTSHCVACHTIYGVPTMLGVTGPNLTHVASRQLLAGGVYERSPDTLHAWLKNPQAVKPGTLMNLTGVNLTDAQIDDIVAYLQSLK
jgi:cytochrome c oxidase subunit 2